MLEAAAKVEQEQAKQIQKQEEEGIQQALSAGNDEESQIALEQLKEKKSAEPEPAGDSSSSVIQLAHQLQERIIIERPRLGFALTSCHRSCGKELRLVFPFNLLKEGLIEPRGCHPYR